MAAFATAKTNRKGVRDAHGAAGPTGNGTAPALRTRSPAGGATRVRASNTTRQAEERLSADQREGLS